MEIKFDNKTGLPTVEISKDEELSAKDIKDAQIIGKMMKTEAWKTLEKYMEISRESILEAGMKGVGKKDDKDLSAVKWAVLKGWTDCKLLASKIVARAEEFLKDRVPEEEHDDGHEDYI